MTWEEVAGNDLWTGGDIELHMTGKILRARISKIVIVKNVVKFFIHWLAEFDPESPTRWKAKEWPIRIPLVEGEVDFLKPEKMEDGRMEITVKECKGFPTVLYPKNSPGLLSSSLVVGL